MAWKLKQRGYEGNVIKEALDELEKQGILNDRVYANDLVSRFRFAKPSGTRKMRFELKRHGISEKLSAEVLEPIGEEEEMSRARELVLSRLPRLERLEPLKKKKRLYDLLMRRGFDYPIVRDVVEEMIRTPDAL